MESLMFIVLVLPFLVVSFFIFNVVSYFSNLSNTLKAASPSNRKMEPVNVWIMAIPILGTFVSFIAVLKISETIIAEFQAKGQKLENTKPTLWSGMLMSTCRAIMWLIHYYIINYTAYTERPYVISGDLGGGFNFFTARQEAIMEQFFNWSWVVFIWLISCIVYWVQTAGYKNKMKSLSNNNADSQEL